MFHTLKLCVISIESGHIYDEIPLDVGFEWRYDDTLYVEFSAVHSLSPRLFIATRRDLCCISFSGSGDRLAELTISKVHFPSEGMPRGICHHGSHLYVCVNEKLLEYSVRSQEDDEQLLAESQPAPTTAFTAPEQDLPPDGALFPPFFDGCGCDATHVALAYPSLHLVYLVERRLPPEPGAERALDFDDEPRGFRRYTGGGAFVAPFNVSLTPQHLCVLDSEAADDRLVVLDRVSGSPLQMMRFGPPGSCNIRRLAFTDDYRHVLLADVNRRTLGVLSVVHVAEDADARPPAVSSTHHPMIRATCADECTFVKPGHFTPFALRGHGHGALALLERLLGGSAHDDEPGLRDRWTDRELIGLYDRLVHWTHVETLRDQLWMVLLALLVDEPHLRTCLTIPTRMEERFWGLERFGLSREPARLPMDRPGLKQTTLKTRPIAVRWEWALGSE